MILRHYQTAAIEATYKFFAEKKGSPLIVLPTGTGKSLVIADFIKGAIEAFPKTRIMMLTHSRELIGQNYAELKELWPDAPVGIYSAGLNRRDIHSQVLYAGIQSVFRRVDDFPVPDLLIVDEAHTMPRDSSTMYGKVIENFRRRNPAFKLIGLTATPYRLDSGYLHTGPDALFDGIAYEYGVAEAIEEGFLSHVTSKATDYKQDTSGVGKRGGDFIPGQLEAAVNKDDLNDAACAEILEKASDRGSWLIFCAGISHAKNIAEKLNTADIVTEVVTGDTNTNERDRILTDFKAGKIQAITNVGVLTTGFNAPGIDLIVLLRATQSCGLYLQQVGRATRLAEGKQDALVLDFAGNVSRHGPIDMPRVDDNDPTDGTGEAPVKECPECFEIVFAGLRICSACGYEFPPNEIKLTKTASKDAILSKDIEAEWCDVKAQNFAIHNKRGGGTPSLRVNYLCGLSMHSEWVCFEHVGFARQKACDWWMKRLPQYPPPTTIEESLKAAPYLPTPSRIKVRPEGKYVKIIETEF